MRYKGSAPFQAFLHSSQGGGVRVRAPEGKDQRRESCVQQTARGTRVQASRTVQTSNTLVCQTIYPYFWQKYGH